MTGIPFPDINPVAISIGPLLIRWYALAYLAGFLGGLYYACWLADLDKKEGRRPNRLDIENILPWIVLGIILGGRIGYVLFYNLGYFIDNPSQIPVIWQGGMSFHGGLIGVITVILCFSRYHKINPLAMGDTISTVVPLGLFFGRLANFVNGELYGRETTMPWGVVFPRGGDVLRHPSQIYEALLEGLVLFVVLHVLARNDKIRNSPGFLFGVLLSGYGICRFIVEFFREPDEQMGYFFTYFSMGQLLCLPMILAGGMFIYNARKKAA